MEKRLEVDIQVIIHATEDLQKILDSFKEMFGVDEEDFAVQNLQGHFENPILFLQCKLKKKKSRGFVKALTENISNEERQEIIDDLENRCDQSALFLRISKQGLVQKRVYLADQDPVKLKIYTPIYTQKDLIRTYSAIMQGTV
ncbi:RNA-binding domain-containing protein [Candidatus Nitrosotenuis cloacae]|jgi:RNA binding exosome subunit|uniref:RNA-binding domain-containing protein n=1 Tax=Candidatus Nitrosotenuis cloacae TaxID=1603555 RepID=UPI0022822319|nr:RNA-binding domain-containing protein [Candidatus Nitrosotenuis cloacae]